MHYAQLTASATALYTADSTQEAKGWHLLAIVCCHKGSTRALGCKKHPKHQQFMKWEGSGKENYME